jgi:hypothetical protein
MRQRVTNELYAYWSSLKGARAAPERSEIDPSAIRHVLADTFMIEIDVQAAYPIRLSGTRLNALQLADQKGSSFLDLWRETDRRSVAAAISMVVDGVAPIVAGARGGVFGQPLDLELLLLPLRHFGRTHSRVMGSLTPIRQPSWFGLVPTSPLGLTSLRVIGETENSSLASSAENRFFNSRRSAARASPRFVVHKGGKPTV